jgi:hypothetical protein
MVVLGGRIGDEHPECTGGRKEEDEEQPKNQPGSERMI